MGKKLLLNDGTPARSVTTIIDGYLGLNKKSLINWYYNMMKVGNDPKAINKYSKKVGKYTHDCLEYYEIGRKLPKKKQDGQDLNTLTLGERAIEEWKELKEQYNIQIKLREESFISERFRYGGRIDNWGFVNGINALIDTKTSKGIYTDHIIQLGAYRNLLLEHGYDVQSIYILGISKDPTRDKILTLTELSEEKINLGFEMFKTLLSLDDINKRMENLV